MACAPSPGKETAKVVLQNGMSFMKPNCATKCVFFVYVENSLFAYILYFFVVRRFIFQNYMLRCKP